MHLISRLVLAVLSVTSSLIVSGQLPQGPVQPEDGRPTSLRNAAQTQQQPQATGSAAGLQLQSGQPKSPETQTYGAMLKKSVAFLSVSYQDGDKVTTIYGTAFFVFYGGVEPGSAGFVYLITNRHMADPQVNGQAAKVIRATLRVNAKTDAGGLQSVDILLPLGVGCRWYFPTDSSVDLAAMQVSQGSNEHAILRVPPGKSADEVFDINPFPISLFATKEEIAKLHIDVGDNVLFAGFFYQLPGQQTVEPIIRQGVLAMLPEENLTTTLGKPGHLYLADVHVFGGNSGSPLFVNVAGPRAYGNQTTEIAGFPYRLLGVISGYFYEAQDFSFQVATTVSGKANANSGISMVVPADEVKALLDLQELQTIRDANTPQGAQ